MLSSKLFVWVLGGGKLIRSKAASSNTAVNNVCKAVHPFLSDHLVRVLTEDAVDGMADDDRRLLGPHLCPHNQRQNMLSMGYQSERSSRAEKCLRRLANTV